MKREDVDKLNHLIEKIDALNDINTDLDMRQFEIVLKAPQFDYGTIDKFGRVEKYSGYDDRDSETFLKISEEYNSELFKVLSKVIVDGFLKEKARLEAELDDIELITHIQRKSD